MTIPKTQQITSENFDACLFDLDGVITKTAAVHAKAWKAMFNEYLADRAEKTQSEFVPFTIEGDYASYVDGKPRYDGVRSFLESRNIDLPHGTPDDSSDVETVCGLGNRKNETVVKTLETDGVEVYPGSISLLHHVRSVGIKTALVSSSANALAVLKAADIEDLFDTRVDGVTIAEKKLVGKPAPDTYLYAASRLGATPHRAVVFEDAISGVQSGRAGKFGLVVGVDRTGDPDALLTNGADIVSNDLSDLIA